MEEQLREAADRRKANHPNSPDERRFSPDYELVGLRGEWEFALLSGIMPDFADKPEGDSGIDFLVPIVLSVDVKTARKANYLLHEVGKSFADLYVLAEYDEITGKTTMVGWTWGTVLRKAPVDDGEKFKHGVRNHYIARQKLRPMDELKQFLGKWRRIGEAA